MQIQPESMWGHFLTIALPVILGLGAQQWWLHRANAKAIKDRDQRLSFVLSEHLPHSHGECAKAEQSGKTETLTTDGLRFPNTKINGS